MSILVASGIIIEKAAPILDEWAYWAPDGNTNLPAPPVLTGGTQDAALVTAIPTFHSCSIYWVPATGGPAEPCQIIFRPVGETVWHEGLAPYWDDFPRLKEQPVEQYITALVHLKPGTFYEGRIQLSNDQFDEFTFTTWTDPADLPIGTTTLLPETSAAKLTIGAGDSGTAEAWHLYTFDPANGSAEIDVANAERSCVENDGASFILFRKVTLKGGSRNGIYLKNTVSDFIVDECDISEWGSGGVAPWGQTRDAAFSTEDRDLTERTNDTTRLVIQRCTIHDPRFDSNAWDQPTDPTHPEGPQAFWITNSNGNNVIRYCDIKGSGDEVKKYNDPVSGGFNDTEQGFPGPDSDIYGNSAREGWDDAFEIDGGGRNIRLWGNYTDSVFVAYSVSPVHLGPVYIFNNVADRSRRTNAAQASNNGGCFIKMQSFISANSFGFGRIYVFNNTMIQSGGNNFGHRAGIAPAGTPARAPRNTVTRNNILEVADLKSIDSPGDAANARKNDYDFDLGSGAFDAYTGAEANGITGTPTYKNGNPAYTPAAPSGDYELDAASNGYNDGEYQPGFNANMNGTNPDRGPHEKGRAKMQFAPEADR